MWVRRVIGAHGRVGIVQSACCGAAPGAASPGTSVPRIATGAPPGTGTAIAASVWLGRSPHESLFPYLGGPGGEAPWLNFWGHVRNRLPIDPQDSQHLRDGHINTKPPPDFFNLPGTYWAVFSHLSTQGGLIWPVSLMVQTV